MANLQANLRSQCTLAVEELQTLLRSVNRLFYENTTDSAYATLFFGAYDDETRGLHYANCGHLCALLLRSGGTVERLHSTSTVVGLFKNRDCSMADEQLFPGDMLALYTDGITESFNDLEEEFGEERLIEALARYGEVNSYDLGVTILRRRRSRGQSKDYGNRRAGWLPQNGGL